jgi:hypoxanthine phosphoribosyltransferase
MEVLIKKEDIQKRVHQIAADIVSEHKDSGSILPPVVVCVLNGGFMFFNDLIRELRVLGLDVETEFIRIKSYNGKDNSSGPIIIKDFEVDLKGKRVYLVDDMCETGTTLLEAVQMASSRVPNSIQIVTMIERVNGKHMSDHVGFTIETDQWLVGYGLDNNQLDRTLEDIYTIN